MRTIWQGEPSAAQLREVQDAVAEVVGDSMTVSVQSCDSIAIEPNGKFKVVKRSAELG